MTEQTGYTDLNEEDRAFYAGLFTSGYLNGRCVPMAIALARALNAPLVAVRDRDRLYHVGVRTGADLYRDVRGEMNGMAFTRPYKLTSLNIKELDEPALRAEIRRTQLIEINEADIAAAAKDAALIAADLPGSVAHAARVTAFGEALTALCRAHGIFIREGVHNGIIAYEAYGEEKGYSFHRISPTQMTMRRVL